MAFILIRPLATHQAESITTINALAGDKILSSYPIYKQLNLGRDNSSLSSAAMYAYIDSIRTLSNVANTAISSAADVAEIRGIEAQFVADLNNL